MIEQIRIRYRCDHCGKTEEVFRTQPIQLNEALWALPSGWMYWNDERNGTVRHFDSFACLDACMGLLPAQTETP